MDRTSHEATVRSGVPLTHPDGGTPPDPRASRKLRVYGRREGRPSAISIAQELYLIVGHQHIVRPLVQDRGTLRPSVLAGNLGTQVLVQQEGYGPAKLVPGQVTRCLAGASPVSAPVWHLVGTYWWCRWA